MKAPAERRSPERDSVHRRAPTPVTDESRAADAPGLRSTAPLSRAVAQRLQASAGNRAVSALVAQRRKAARPAKPVAQRSPSPRSGPGVPAQRATTATAPSTTTASGTIAPDTSAAIVSASPAAPTLEPTAPQSSTAADLAVQRAPVETATPVRRPPASASPKFAAVRADVGRKQKTVAAHPPARSEAAKAQGAAKPPPDDKEAQGKTRNAEKMNAAKPGSFDRAAFITAVNEAIAAQAPKNLDEADKFGDSGRADAVKGQVQGQVAAGTDASAKAIATTTKAAPDTSAAKEKPVTPLVADKPPATPARPDPGKAVPDKAPPAATDFSAGPAQVDQQMADAKVTDDQLARSNEPEFTGALKEKKAAEKHAATAPAQVRAEEKETLTGAKAQAATAGATAMTALAGDRKQAGSQVDSGKEKAKSADEAKRAKVTAVLQKVFDTTKKDVEGILSGLDKKVDAAFTKGEKAARDAFTADHKRRMKAYKEKRYSGLRGKARWVKDKFAGLPAEADQIFTAARQGYVTRMQQVIAGVADIIGTELDRAKQRIATGRNQLQATVRKLPADLQAIGRQAAGQFTAKFDQLVDSVDAKGKQLVQTLASKYNEALKAVDAEINAEKEKNRGLVAKAVDAVKGAIETILQLKEMLMGILAKAAQAVMAILKDPIGFLRNLVSAVGAGLKLFIGNIGTHLKKGLIGWLLGAMAGAGLQMPAKFDLRGIITMVASMLGLTWASIRARVVQRGVPERAMTTVEQTVPVAQKLQSQGVAGVTDEIAGQVGDLKGNLLSKISAYLIPTVLIAGITWIISLLNPASAFIRACKMIIDFVTFVVTQGAQIVQFVHAILDAVIAIAGGGSGGVPGLVENALSRSVPVLIGTLAALLGIGGIAQKVQTFFRTLSKPVMKAVDWIVGRIVDLGKKIWSKLKGAAGRLKHKARGGDDTPNGKQQRLDKAISAAVSALERYRGRTVSATLLRPILAGIRLRYGLKRLDPVRQGDLWAVHGSINPDRTEPTAARAEEEDAELALIDDGVTPLEERRELLAKARGIVQNETAIGIVFDRIKQGKPGKKKAIQIFRKIVSKNLENGYQIELKKQRDSLGMHYFGLHVDPVAKIGGVQRAGHKGGLLGEAYVKPMMPTPEAEPVPALALDFYIPPHVVNAGIKGVGTAMFKIAAEHFATEYRAVAGEWFTLGWYASEELGRGEMSDNLRAYITARQDSATPEEAVMATWTYRRAKQIYGGADLEIDVRELEDIRKPPRDSLIVQVLMRPKP